MTNYLVVKNQELQYSIWLSNQEIPAGWESCNFSGSKEECLDYIESVWVDMRPLSARHQEVRPENKATAIKRP